MILESFPNEYIDVLRSVVDSHPKDYKIVSTKPYKDGKKYTDVEIDGINEPFDLLALGIRIGLEQADRNAIDKIIPAIIGIVDKELDEQKKPSAN